MRTMHSLFALQDVEESETHAERLERLKRVVAEQQPAATGSHLVPELA